MSGSLLLGLLVLAYGMVVVVPAMSEILPFKLFEFSNRYTILHWPIIFYLALICRVYGDISLLALSLLLGALTLNFLYKGKYRSFTLGISSVLNICALCFIIWQEYLSNAANMSHY